MGACCPKCTKVCGGLMLLLGLAFLSVDLAMWDFWGVSWWTAVLLLLAVGKLKGPCKDCLKMSKKR